MSLVKKGVLVLTEYMIVIISSFPFIAHPAGFLSTIKLKTADWMAPNKAIIAVLEYLHGYFLPILACIRNQLRWMLSKLWNQWPSHQPSCLSSSYWRRLSCDLWLPSKMAFLCKGSALELHRCKQLHLIPYSSHPSFSCSISLGCKCLKGFVKNQFKATTDDQLIL